MSIIEGVDDEIVVAVGAFAVVSTAVALAWRSTHVNIAPAAEPAPPQSEPTASSENVSEGSATPEDNEPPPSTGQSLRLKLKFLNDTERIVDVTEDWNIGQLKRIHLAQEMDEGRKVVRLVFRGRELADVSQKISEAGLTGDATIHCLVSDRPQSSQSSSGQPTSQQQNYAQGIRRHNANFDNLAEYDEVGRLLMPLLSVVLGCVWFARIKYRFLFDGFSSLALIAFTLAFLAAVAAHFYRLLGFGRAATPRPNVPPRNDDSSSRPPGGGQEVPISAQPANPASYPSYPPPPYSPSSNRPHVD